MTLEVLTFGCRLNAAESEAMRGRATEAGLDDAVLVNTCAVTAEAVRQARQAIRKARRKHPGRRIVVSGCAAQTEPETFAAMPEVDLVIGNAEKLSAEHYRRAARPGDFGIGATEKIVVGDIFSVRETASHLLDGVSDRVRAFVQVQNGCDHRCTFCIIPYGRGNSRSVPMGAVVNEVRSLVENGVREVVLTGVDITAWGGDLPGGPRLGSLVHAILRHVRELPRLRLSSIDSVEADDELMRALAEEARLMPHLHLSLQAGDDMILKRMKRRHLRADAIRFCDAARKLRPDIVLGADLIVGFPTETEEMFANTLSLVEECGLTLLHVFPFSPRAGTPAARMRAVERNLVQQRAAMLRRRGHHALSQRLGSEVDKFRSVLVEKPGFGRTEHYLPVEIDGGDAGDMVSTKISRTDGKSLYTNIIRAAA